MRVRVFMDQAENERFRTRIVRAYDITPETFSSVLDYCRANKADMLIVRCGTCDLPMVHLLEDWGAHLMDTLVYYSRTAEPIGSDENGDFIIRPVREGEETEVRSIARDTFRDYIDHYHADPRLQEEAADEAFASWAYRSCRDSNIADEVLIAVEGDAIVAFATLRLNDPKEGEGVLFGVRPSAQGRGVYGLLIEGGINWCNQQGAERMIVSTQINNYIVQHAWVKRGFLHYNSIYTFHYWFS